MTKPDWKRPDALDRVYIDGFKNLKGVDIDFDEERPTIVVIGQNGTGNSNLIEAITDVFRFVDMNRGAPRFVTRLTTVSATERFASPIARVGRCHCGR